MDRKGSEVKILRPESSFGAIHRHNIKFKQKGARFKFFRQIYKVLYIFVKRVENYMNIKLSAMYRGVFVYKYLPP